MRAAVSDSTPAANPRRSVRDAIASRLGRRRTSATPMTRIEESSTIATPAMNVASTMNDRYVQFSAESA